jgi:Ca-activated chloride channel family protein
MDVAVSLDHQLLAVEAEHAVHVMLEVSVPTANPDAGRSPLILGVVLDRSGSMSGGPLATAVTAARDLLSRLPAGDRAALVAFDDQVEVVAGVGSPDRPELAAGLAALHSRGSTNLSGGWLKAAELLSDTKGEGPRRILLLTDGHANQGVVDPAVLAQMSRERGRAGIATSTIGLGEHFSEELLTGMATASGGSEHHAASVEDLPGVFAEEFADLAGLVIQNLSVEIRPGPGVTSVGLLNQYEVLPVEGGLQVQVGDAYAGERRRIVVEMGVPAIAALGPAQVAALVVRWVALGDAITHHQMTLPVVVNLVSADEAATTVPDATVTEEVTVLVAGKGAAVARRLAEEGRFDEARERLQADVAALRQLAPTSPRAALLLEQADELDSATDSLTAAAYSPMSSKALHYSSTNRSKRNRPRPNPGGAS